MPDTDNDLFGDDLEDEASGVTEGGSQAPESDAGDDPKAAKRIADAQRALHKEQARAKALEKELEELKAKGAEPEDREKAPQAPEVNSELLEDWREAAWERYPAFKDFGIEIDAIQGGTRTEIRQSASALAKFIEEVESKVRNRVLAEHGLAADGLGGGKRETYPDFDSMSSEDFMKFVEKRAGFR